MLSLPHGKTAFARCDYQLGGVGYFQHGLFRWFIFYDYFKLTGLDKCSIHAVAQTLQRKRFRTNASQQSYHATTFQPWLKAISITRSKLIAFVHHG